jgi:3-hydroxyisobutyrate dehydrogenase-like beta-hydroxyacid dehydrogenase
MQVGFIGLGHMGAAMAARLVGAGHDVTVYNRNPEKRRPLVELGATAATSPADACRGAAVITMLADDPALEQLALGPDGITQSLAPGAVHISMSTISVTLSRKLALAHKNAGQRFMAAPVLGRPEAAAIGKLFIIAGGDTATIKSCKPLLDVIGQRTIAISDEPAGANLAKLAANFLFASAIEALGESVALVGKGGLDRQAFIDLLTSTVLTAPAYKTYGDLIVQHRFSPAGFAAVLGHKDIRLALGVAEELRVPMPLASLLNERFLRLLARGGNDLDWSAIGGLAGLDAGDQRTALTVSAKK